jgi:hypothetical protein
MKIVTLSIRGVVNFKLTLNSGQGPAYVDKLLRGHKAIKVDSGVYVRPEAVSHFTIMESE